MLLAARVLPQALLKAALAAAGSDARANEALYYVALRHLGTTRIGRTAAIHAAHTGAQATPARLHPLGHFGTAKVDRGPESALYTVESLLHDLESNRAGTQHVDELRHAFNYARCMLKGEFVEAYGRWYSLPGTRDALDALKSLPAPRASRWPRDTTLAVILPGSPDAERQEEVDGHKLIARTSWDPNKCPADARVDIVFMNQDRFLQLVNRREEVVARQHQVPLIVTKTSAQSLARVPKELRPYVRFDLAEPSVPTSRVTYLIVMAAMWTMSNLNHPATFYFADFYLSQNLYHDTKYDSKRLLETVDDVRRSYFAHDVFFVHAALRTWTAQGRILAPGRLGEILAWSGDEFARQLESAWGGTRKGAQRTSTTPKPASVGKEGSEPGRSRKPWP